MATLPTRCAMTGGAIWACRITRTTSRIRSRGTNRDLGAGAFSNCKHVCARGHLSLKFAP
eukprot:scaffold7260_cov63-Phaeocystis_antarctica.AAC.4